MTILKLQAREDIFRPDYVGGDSLEYCIENNLFHIIHPKGTIVYCHIEPWQDPFFKGVSIKEIFNGRQYYSGQCNYYSEPECLNKVSWLWGTRANEWELLDILNI